MEDYEYDEGAGGAAFESIPAEETLEVGNTFYNEEQILSQQQEALEAVKKGFVSDVVPEAVREFLRYFQKCLHDKNVYELHACYDSSFKKLTEKFYKNASWPSPATVEAISSKDQIFLMFYKEVYYRHLYAKGNPTIEERFDSYHNYCNLFAFIINSEDPTDIELPTQWTWDMIDEFIYQFNSFVIYRTRAIRKNNPAEVELLEKNVGVWSAYPVLNVLYSLAGKANIIAQLRAQNQMTQVAKEVAGPFGSRPLYRNLGYFSIIGLLRVHTLLGDFPLALKTMEEIQLNKKAHFTRVTGAHFTTYYYVGFCYLMLRRYADAIKAFSHILLYISRTKNITRNASFDSVNKKSDQMYALLAICVTLSPTRLDDVVHTGLREKYGEHLSKMNRGGQEALNTFEELFVFAAPKFISPTPAEADSLDLSYDSLQHHLNIFMESVKSATDTSNLKSYLNMYATMDISKLAGFADKDVEELRSDLVSFKIKNRQIKWTDGQLLRGTSISLSEVDIALENDLIHIAESKVSRKFADWFLRNTGKNYSVQEFIANPEKVIDKERDSERKSSSKKVGGKPKEQSK